MVPELPARLLHRYCSAPPSKCLWVGNLQKKVTDEDLMKLFRKFKPLGVTSDGARRFRFLSFSRVKNAVAAKDSLQGAILKGRRIKIEFAVKGPEPDPDDEVLQNAPDGLMAREHECSPLRFPMESQDDNLGSYRCSGFELTSRQSELNTEGQVLHDPPRTVMAYTPEGSPLMFTVEPRDANIDRYYRCNASLIPRCEVDRYLSNLDGIIEFFLKHTAALTEAYGQVVSERDQARRDWDQARRVAGSGERDLNKGLGLPS